MADAPTIAGPNQHVQGITPPTQNGTSARDSTTTTPQSPADAPDPVQRSPFLFIRMHKDIQNPELHDIGRKVGLVVALFFFAAVILFRDLLVAFVNSFIADTVSNQETQARISEMANTTVLGLLENDAVMDTLKHKLTLIIGDPSTRQALQDMITSEEMIASVKHMIEEQLRNPELTTILTAKVTEFSQDPLFHFDLAVLLQGVAIRSLKKLARKVVIKTVKPHEDIIQPLFNRGLLKMMARVDDLEQLDTLEDVHPDGGVAPDVEAFNAHEEMRRLLREPSLQNEILHLFEEDCVVDAFTTKLMELTNHILDEQTKLHIVHDLHTIVVAELIANCGDSYTAAKVPTAPDTFEAIVEARLAARKLRAQHRRDLALAGTSSDDEGKKKD